jgi:hypothetical protein
MRARRHVARVSIPHWAALIGLADDDQSRAAARALIAQGDGPEVVQVRRWRRTNAGVLLRSHRRWLRANPWAKFLAEETERNRRK